MSSSDVDVRRCVPRGPEDHGDHVIVDASGRRASVVRDERSALFSPTSVVEGSSFARAPTHRDLRPARATVEILRHGGGMMPRALLGGVFTPDGGKELLVEVFTSGRGSQGQPTCESRLSSPLIPGLPDEFAHSVVGGLVGGRLSGGRVIVDRAAFDPVESSPMAFGLAAGLLSVVLESLSEGRDVERVVRDVMKGRS